MKAINILSGAGDAHARIVSRAVRSLGGVCEVLEVFSFPADKNFSALINTDVDFFAGEKSVADAQVVWHRRSALTDKSSHNDAARMDVIEWECIAARRAAWATLESLGATWVNPVTAAWAAENKASQLLAAQAVGLKVPNTLISNDPARIRAFSAQYGEAGIVHKMFHAAQFGQKVACAALLTPTVLANDDLLSAVPGIYQDRQRLECDIRVFIVGKTLVAAEIKNVAGIHIDSRILAHKPGCVRALTLDPRLTEQCFALLERLGIVTGSIDLGLGLDGEPVFFEVNQAGNFLWMEQCDERLPVLDIFARFLMANDPFFEYCENSGSRLAFSSFAD